MGQSKQTPKKKSQTKSSRNTIDTETHVHIQVFHKNTKLKTVICMERTCKEKLKNKNS